MSCGHTKFEGSPPCPCYWQNTTDVGIDVSGHATVSLVDYGVLKERERIVRMLVADAGDWHEGLDVCESGCCHCPAIDLIEGETK
jgi:hypothetical protein